VKGFPAFLHVASEKLVQGGVGDLVFATVAADHDEAVKVFGVPPSRSCTNWALHTALNAAVRFKFQTWPCLPPLNRALPTSASCQAKHCDP
jgi:hypothetical protein